MARSVGALLRTEREARGMTLAEVSEATGIAVPNLSRIERGAVEVRAGTLMRIADALDAELTLIPRRPVLTLAEVRRRARSGRRALDAAGLGPSNPAARLARRASAGDDVAVESTTLKDGPT